MTIEFYDIIEIRSNAKIPAEIDFVAQYNNRVVPVEVKAEENVRARSLAHTSLLKPNL